MKNSYSHREVLKLGVGSVALDAASSGAVTLTDNQAEESFALADEGGLLTKEQTDGIEVTWLNAVKYTWHIKQLRGSVNKGG